MPDALYGGLWRESGLFERTIMSTDDQKHICALILSYDSVLQTEV